MRNRFHGHAFVGFLVAAVFSCGKVEDDRSSTNSELGDLLTAEGSLPTPTPSTPLPEHGDPALLTPTVACVINIDKEHWSGVFGYTNAGTASIVVNLGARNELVAGKNTDTGDDQHVTSGGQPQTFLPGVHMAVFAVGFHGDHVGWSLGGKTVLARKSAPRCLFRKSPGDTPVLATSPQLVISDDGSPPPPATYAPHIVSPPPFEGSGATATANAKAFVDWLGASVASQGDLAKATIAAAGDNADLANALIDDFNLSETSATPDFTRAVLDLSVLGEMRSTVGEVFMSALVDQLLPSDPLQFGALVMLQSRAVDGLANQGTSTADAKLLVVIRNSPTTTVRWEAIRAWIFHHPDTFQGDLAQVVRPEDAWVIDRIENRGDPATFAKRLAFFQASHPEFTPDPVKPAP